jgi:flagellin-like hook-associated protein FlgL
MPGQPLRIGPFIGGLNTSSDPTAIADAELVECINFEREIDGNLISRPPLSELQGSASWTERIVLIGEGIFNGIHYLIGSNTDGVFYSQSGSGAWTAITTTFQSYVAVQYAGFMYIVAEPGSANPGGKWSPSGGFTAVSAIPKGMSAVVHKERLFIVPGMYSTTNESRVTFSDAGDFETYQPTNFIDVGQGDGTNLIDLTVYQDNLLLFKSKSTYLLAYDTRPTDAQSRKLSDTIGVDRQFCVLNYENQIYILHNGWVYEIISYDFNRLNTKVPFVRNTTSPSAMADECVFISLLGDRLICRYFRNIYVYSLRTRTWSMWESEADRLHFFGPVKKLHKSTGTEYYAGSALSAYTTVIQLFDGSTSSTFESVDTPTQSITDDASVATTDGWGTCTSGEAWSVYGGSASTFSKSSGQALISVTAKDTFHNVGVAVPYADLDATVTFSVSDVATTGTLITSFRFRDNTTGTFYRVRCEWGTDGNLRHRLVKSVSGTETTVGPTATVVGTYTDNELFTIRIRAVGSSIRYKIWKAASVEPGTWNSSQTDSDISSAGLFTASAYVMTASTNPTPVIFAFDNVAIGQSSDTFRTINCRIKTKNFDMAIPHQFKRLWWWGVDASTSNNITGEAEVIVVNFSVTWNQLASYTWNQISGNTWNQPLTTPSLVSTVVSVTSAVSRRFFKFLKGLRYRQINFRIYMTTGGSTADGPARVFSITAITESKQTVTKAVS